jgi:type IV pilus assembly protein PilB
MAIPQVEALPIVPVRALGTSSIAYDTLRYIPEESARHYRIAPLVVTPDGVLEVGMVEPDDIQALDALNFITRKSGMPFKVFKISPDDFEKVLEMYKGLTGDVNKAIADLATTGGTMESADEQPDILALTETISTQQSGVNLQEDAPAIKLVSTILRYAIDGKSSDVHIEPGADGVRVRYRVDGDLHTSVVLPAASQRAIIARVKVLANMRLDERRKPQDGRFSASIDGRQIDFRVSSLPTYNGEKISIRILDRAAGFVSMNELGLAPRDLQLIRDAISQPHGLVLISGPTGSGKSTTLYSMLSELDREKKNVLSLEDPVEYYVDGVNQSQMRPEIGYTFASGLRTTLRQDPDVIMVGEIRDGETAKLAIQAALTGHLVLSTIHTNSAVGVVPRLIDMGVEPYLIAPTLICTIGQRLVRKMSEGAAVAQPVTEPMRKLIEQDFSDLPVDMRPPIPEFVYEAQRTPTSPTGMKGRLAVFEVVDMSAEMEKVILKSPVESALWKVARTQGMRTMKEDAMLKCFNKLTSWSEVTSLGGLAELDDIVPVNVVPPPVTVEEDRVDESDDKPPQVIQL